MYALFALLLGTVCFVFFTLPNLVLAEPQQLDCVLTDTEAHPDSERRPIVIVFDQDAKTLSAKEGDRNHSFSRVSISNVTINALGDDLSVGIDRSSLGIVWQQYKTDKISTEYGHCRIHS